MDNFALYVKLGIKIKELRLKNHLKQNELAEELGLTPATLARYEKGQKRMSIDTLQVSADYFGTTMDDLLGNEYAKDQSTTYDKVVNLIKDYNLDDNEYIKMIEYLEFIVSKREKKNDVPKPLDETIFELKENQYDVFKNQEDKTYVRLEDEKMR